MRKIFSTALKAVAGLALAASANMATAATPITNISGKLTGASGVSVNSQLFTVAFEDGTCESVFGVCDSGIFQFQDSASAEAAASALLTQVFTGIYDLIPGLTQGCNLNVGSCRVLIPYAVTGSNVVSGFALNRIVGDTTGTGFQLTQTTDTTRSASVTYAVFALEQNPSSAVPEPSTWLLMMAGFGVAGMALRRGKVADRRVAFA